MYTRICCKEPGCSDLNTTDSSKGYLNVAGNGTKPWMGAVP